MKKLILFVLLVIVLTACGGGGGKGKPTLEPTIQTLIDTSVDLKSTLDESDFPITEPISDTTNYPVPGDTPVPCSLLISAWARYDPNMWDIQEIGIELSCDGYAYANQIAIVCVDSVCMDTRTDSQGYSFLQFPRTWGVGSVPYSVCVDGVCLRSSFTGE